MMGDKTIRYFGFSRIRWPLAMEYHRLGTIDWASSFDLIFLRFFVILFYRHPEG